MNTQVVTTIPRCEECLRYGIQKRAFGLALVGGDKVPLCRAHINAKKPLSVGVYILPH